MSLKTCRPRYSKVISCKQKIRKHPNREGTLLRSSISKKHSATRDYLKEEVKILKGWLNSGNLKHQVKAVNELLIILGNRTDKYRESTVKYLLDADIAIFLSEAIESNHQFIELAFDGLVTIVTDKGWINHPQINRIVDSSLRIISTVISHKGNANILFWTLKLLVEIFQTAVHLGCSELLSNVVCIDNVCKQLKIVFGYLKCNPKSKLKAVFTAQKLLQLMFDKSFFVYLTNSTLLGNLLEAKNECFQVLSKLVNPGKEINCNNENILFMTQTNLNHMRLCYFFERNCTRMHGVSPDDVSCMQSACTAALIDVAENIEHVIAPFMKNLNFNLADDRNLHMWKNFLECLHAFFNSTFKDKTRNIANILLISEYLELLAAIFRDSGEEYRNISTLCLKCLGDILVRVSLEELNIACHFEPPFKAFKMYLRTGLQLFPREPKNWLGVLSERKAPLCQQDAAIVFLFFLLKAKKRLNIAKISGPHVCTNIILRSTAKKGICTSLPIVKALWLCLAIISRHYHDPLVDQASSGMVQLLAHYSLLSVYNDHASILWWIFSMDTIPKRLQEHVVIIFLDEKSSKKDDIFVKLLIKKGEQPALCLLRIAHNKKTTQNMVDKVFHILQEAFCKRGKKLYNVLWKLLPYSLKSAIASETAGITTNILELAAQCRKASDIGLDRNDALILVDLLITACVMQTHNPLPVVFYRAAIHVISALLKFVTGQWIQDTMVISGFFNKRFMHLLLHSISECPDQVLYVESLKLLSFMMWLNIKVRLKINWEPICIDVKNLVRCLMLFDPETSKATLQLMHILTKTENASIITLQQGSESIIHQPIRTLSYQMYNVYTKASDKSVLHKSWICLPGLLSYASIKTHTAWLHIITTPWFFKFLVLFCTTAEYFSKHCITFLEEWLQVSEKCHYTSSAFHSKRDLDERIKRRAKADQKNMKKHITDNAKAQVLVKDLVSGKKVCCKSLQQDSGNVDV